MHLIERNVHGASSVYKQIYDVKKKQTKQTSTDIFLKRVTPPQEEPQAGPSGRILEKGLALVGDDSSTRVIVPALPMGREVEGKDSGTDHPHPA